MGIGGVVVVVVVVGWGWGNWESKGRVKERDHAYLAILVFCARNHGEPLIVQHRSSGNKRGPHCCCH